MKPLLRITLSIVLAVASTAGVYFWDQSRNSTYQINEALQWARQIAVQAEGLAIEGRSVGQPDPAAWAIGFLSQAVEPRTMRISKFKRPLGTQIEFYRTENGIFDYGKVAQPENGEGFRVRIPLAFRGFLGARSKAESDLALLLLFLCFLTPISILVLRLSPDSNTKVLAGCLVPEWLKESELTIMGLGVALRDLVKDAHGLAAHTVKSREQFIFMLENLSEVREALKSVRLAVCSEAAQMDAHEAGATNSQLNGFRLFEEQLIEIEAMLNTLCSGESVDSLGQEFPALARKFNNDVSVLKTSVIAQLGLMQKLKQQLKSDQVPKQAA